MRKRRSRVILNRPYRYRGRGRYKMSVKVKVGGRVKTIHFGHKGYRHNYSRAARKSYCARSAGIRGRGGKLTKNSRASANYWARRMWNCGM